MIDEIDDDDLTLSMYWLWNYYQFYSNCSYVIDRNVSICFEELTVINLEERIESMKRSIMETTNLNQKKEQELITLHGEINSNEERLKNLRSSLDSIISELNKTEKEIIQREVF